jgi:Fic family protein
LRSIDVALPPQIAAIDVSLDGDLAAQIEAATVHIVALDRAHAPVLDPLSILLLRTESVASSKIERISAGIDDYARAERGGRANEAAMDMVAGTQATASLIRSVEAGRPVALSALLDAHRILTAAHPEVGPGRLRRVQNWIGGSDHSPLDALYVPPAPDLVDGAMGDLLAFTGRSDVPALAQAALAHAHFESIHPFIDGNGRIGRALVNAILRSRGTTRSVVVPIASALVAHRDRYFDALTDYRSGDARPVVSAFASAAEVAASESERTAVRLSEVAGEWRAQLGRVRAGSATEVALAHLAADPIVTVDDIARWAGVSDANAHVAVDRLVGAGVLRPLTTRKRGQVWGAGAILDEIESLGNRIARSAR